MKTDYLKKLDRWLTSHVGKLLDSYDKQPYDEGMETISAFKKAMTDEILESYRNGFRAGAKAPSVPVKKD